MKIRLAKKIIKNPGRYSRHIQRRAWSRMQALEIAEFRRLAKKARAGMPWRRARPINPTKDLKRAFRPLLPTVTEMSYAEHHEHLIRLACQSLHIPFSLIESGREVAQSPCRDLIVYTSPASG